MKIRSQRSYGVALALTLCGAATAIYIIAGPTTDRNKMGQKAVNSVLLENTVASNSPGTPENMAVYKSATDTKEQRHAFTLDSATAQISGASAPLSSADGLFDRAFIPEKGITKVRVSLPYLLAGEEVTISAPNGGKLLRKNGPLRFTPKTEGSADLDLALEPTMGRGVYTITIRQAGALAALDFWAGPTNPVGDAGPSYVSTSPTENEIVP